MVEGEDYNQERQRHYRAPPQKKWYKKPWVFYLGAGLLILLIILGATGRLSADKPGIPGNQTIVEEPTIEDQLVNYVIAQRDTGMKDSDIKQRLVLSGYTESDIIRAFQLSDPLVQYIKTELEKGTSKPVLVEKLLKDGHTPATISDIFELLESKPLGLGDALQKYWWIIVIGIIAIYFIKRQQDIIEEKKSPKIYSLKECLETAEHELKERNLQYSPPKEYKNRPELREYRYVFEEPLFPEFNHHKPTGNSIGGRRYYLIGIGYDKELSDFRMTMNDTEIRPFLYGKPKSWEQRSANEYLQLRTRSDVPIEDLEKERQYQHEERDRFSTRRPMRRSITPGPIEGFESV